LILRLERLVHIGGAFLILQGCPAKTFFCACAAFFLLIACSPAFFPANRAYAQGRSFTTVINPDDYIVAPGDQFRIDFWDGAVNSLNLTVTPEGSVLIASMGLVDVGGLTLSEAKGRLRELVSVFYSDVDFTISLVGIRSVKVLITGGVNKPGLYDGFVSQRVSEAIALSGGFAPGASRRNIKLFNGDHDRIVDILQYERTGDLEANPYLYAGYRIHVPLVTDSSAFIQISGEVIEPGGLEYKQGDNLGSIIELAHGLNGLEGDSIYLFRREGDGYRQLSVSIRELGFSVRPADKIIVSRAVKDLAADYYSITGAVRAAGRYPYRNGMNLEWSFRMAGGLLEDADVRSTAVYRKTGFERSSGTAKILTANNLNEVSFTTDRELVSLNVGRSFPEHLSEVALYPGDSVVVPLKTGSVGIYGMVNRPGMLKYTGSMKASYLIKMAGGYARGADKGYVQVVRKVSGIKITTGTGIDIYDGDTVMVPREARTKSFWDKLKDLSLILGGLGVVYLTVDNMVD
jgi:protein involved in polysaccharide export with SLBB domain